MARLKCVDELLRGMTETLIPRSLRARNWIISETTFAGGLKPQIAALTTARASSQDAPVLARKFIVVPIVRS